MQIQEIITYIVIAVASGFVLYSLYNTLFPGKSVDQHGGCSSNCNCDAVKMRKDLQINKKKTV
jgi:hypothetical protein